jgi:hypothetical protein
MKKLLELEKKLLEAREALEKQAAMLSDGSDTMSVGSSMVNTAKSEDSKSSHKGKRHKLDVDGDGEIEAEDLAALRQKKKKSKEQLAKFGSQGAPLGSNLGSSITAGISGGGVNVKKKEDKHPDEKEDKKLIAEALDRHNEKKHGEDKDEDSAKKEMKLKKSEEVLISFPNGQWALTKSKKDSEKSNTDDGSILSEPQHRGASGKGRIRMDSIRAKTGNPEDMMIRAEEKAEKAKSKKP